MPEFNKSYLSQGRLSPAGGIPAARARTVSDRAASAGIGIFSGANLRAPEFITTNREPAIDKVGPIVESEEVQRFAFTMNQAALKKADKQAELFAREKVIEARNEFRDMMFGEGGYLTLEPGEAVKARAAFHDKVEETTQRYLGDVPAHVRQKMFPMLNAEREQVLNNMAQYANVQEKEWEKAIRQNEINDFEIQMGEFGLDFNMVDNSIDALANKLYPDNADGTVNEYNKVRRDSLREELLETHVKQLIYTPAAGLDAAISRFSDIEDQLRAQTQISLKEEIMQAVNIYNSEQDRMDRKLRQQKTDQRRGNYQQLISRIMDDDPSNDPTSAEIGADTAGDHITPSAALTLRRILEEDGDDDTDIGDYTTLRNLVDAVDYANLESVQAVQEAIMSNQYRVSAELRRSLLDTLSGVVKGNKKDRYKQALNIIKAETAIDGIDAMVVSEAVEQLRAMAENELAARYSQGEDPVSIAYEMMGRGKNQGSYDPAKVIELNLPPLDLGNGSLQRITDAVQFYRWVHDVYVNIPEGPWKEELRERAKLTRAWLIRSGQDPDNPPPEPPIPEPDIPTVTAPGGGYGLTPSEQSKEPSGAK